MRLSLFSAFLLLLIAACTPREEAPPLKVEGLVPVYTTAEDMALEVQTPRPMRRLGKIYHKAPWLFAVETGEGIHVIDNSNPDNPQPKWFYRIAGCQDMAVKGARLYADQYTDLLVIDLSKPDQLKVLQRQTIRKENAQINLPPDYSGFFQCPDPKKGGVKRWEKAMLTEPGCKTN
jgi:hypothetical protein